MRKPIIEMHDVAHRVGNRFLLKNINWTVYSGEHWVVFGENGSGKTTLLSTIAGYNTFELGTCKVFDEDLKICNLEAMRKRIGWVSGSYFDKFYAKESVKNIVLSGLTGTWGVRGFAENRDILKMKKLLANMGLGDIEDKPYCMLSKGQQQCVLISRALIAEPEILILDEPCTGLDLVNRARVLEQMRKLAENENVTILYVTHYLEEIIDIFKKGMLLKNGEIVCQGHMNSVFNEKNLEKFFGRKIEMKQTIFQ